MNIEKAYQLHCLLKGSRHPVRLTRIMEELECSESTARRLIREMREKLRAPIEVFENPHGYRYSDEARELPGVWLSPPELHALFFLYQMLMSFEPGLLSGFLAPLRRGVEDLLRLQGLDTTQAHRIRLLRVASRPAGPYFGVVSSALLQRHRLTIHYRAPRTLVAKPREVSPQRLSHYRDKWYLDAWCHKQKGLRTFALHRITEASGLDTAAIDVDEARLDSELGSSYGIFAGEPTAIAKLLFTAESADWVDGEVWHPDQKGARLKTGEYLLEIPYGRAEELIKDILRHGPDVEVLAPLALRDSVAEQLIAAAQRYSKPKKKVVEA